MRERERAELLPEIVWKTAKLGELCQLKSGGTPKASVERYYTGDIPFLSIRDMTNCGKHIKDTQKHITQEAVDSCSTWIAPAGSLMYSICASVGNVSFIDVPMAMNQAIVSLTDMKIDSEYLYYYLLSLKGTNYINSKIINGAQPNINGTILRNYEIRYPESLEHQRYVAQILSDLDELSKLHSYKAGILSRVKTQLMNQKSGIIETERQKSDIPLGWMRVKIKDCLDYEQPTKYIVKSTDYRDDYSIPVLTANKTFILGYTDEEFGIYSKGDVIIYDDFTCDSKYVTFPFKVKSGAIKLLTPKQGIDLKFMWYILQTIEVDTSAHKRYYISEVAEQEILIPKELSEQQRIAKLLSTYDETLLSQLNLQEIAERERESNYKENCSCDTAHSSREWIELTIEELFETRNGYTPSKKVPEYWEDGTIPWYRMEDIRANGHILYDSIQHINSCAVKKSGLFPIDSIILATTATIGEHALLKAPALVNQQFTCFTLRDKYKGLVDIDYLYWYFFLIDDWCKLNANTGTSFPTVDISRLKQQKISLPKELSEQRRIAKLLSSYDSMLATETNLIEITERERATTERITRLILSNF